MNDLTNHGVPRAFQLQWRRRPRVVATSWCKRTYGREREWRSRVGLTECGSGTSVDIYRVGTARLVTVPGQKSGPIGIYPATHFFFTHHLNYYYTLKISRFS